MTPNRNHVPSYNGKPRIYRPGETSQEVAIRAAQAEHVRRGIMLAQLGLRIARIEAGLGIASCPTCHGETPCRVYPDRIEWQCEECHGCGTVPTSDTDV